MLFLSDPIIEQNRPLTSSQSILEDLLKAQELKYRQVDRWVEPQTSLVRSEGRVELHTITTIDLHLALVVLPHHTELDDSLWNGSDLESSLVFGVFLEQ